jgi:hypothetical protein
MENLFPLVLGILDDSVAWQQKNSIDLEFPKEDSRRELCAGCYSIAMEFQASILSLLKRNQFALCFASQRLLFEAHVRGLWLQYCADENQLNAFMNGHGPKRLEVMTSAICAALGGDLLGLENLRTKIEGTLHDFTHTGIQHVSRRYSDDALGPNYSLHDKFLIVHMTYQIGMQATMEIFSICGRADLRNQAIEKLVEYNKYYSELRLVNSEIFG